MTTLLLIFQLLFGNIYSTPTQSQPILIAQFNLYVDPVTERLSLKSMADPRLFRSDCEAFKFLILNEDQICSIDELFELNLDYKNSQKY